MSTVQQWLNDYGSKQKTSTLENMLSEATNEADKRAIQDFMSSKTTVTNDVGRQYQVDPKDVQQNAGGTFVTTRDEKGNQAIVNANYLQDYTMNRGYTVGSQEKPLVTYYDPNGMGFTHTTDSKYNNDYYSKMGYVKDQNNSFQELIGLATSGKLTADQLRAELAKIHEGNLATAPNSFQTTPKVAQPTPTAMASTTSTQGGGSGGGYVPYYGSSGGGGGSSGGGFNINNQRAMLEQMYNSRKTSELAALQNELATAQQGYNRLEGDVKQQSTANLNAADRASMQTAQRLKESMANAGLSASGTNEAEMGRLMAQRNADVSNINQFETNQLTDLGQRRNLLNNQAASNERALLQTIESNKIQDLLDLEKYGDQAKFRDSQFNYQMYRDMLNDAYRNDQSSFERRLAEAQLTGNYNGKQTLQGQQSQLALENQKIANQVAQMQMQNLPQQMKQQALQIEQQLKAGDLSLQQAQFNLQQLQDPNSPANVAQKLQNDLLQIQVANLPEQQRLQLEQLRKSIAEIGKAPYRSQQQIELDKLRVEQAKLEIEAIKNPQTNTKVMQDALKLAQQDPNYNFATSAQARQAVLDYYVQMLTGGGISDDDILRYLK